MHCTIHSADSPKAILRRFRRLAALRSLLAQAFLPAAAQAFLPAPPTPDATVAPPRVPAASTTAEAAWPRGPTIQSNNATENSRAILQRHGMREARVHDPSSLVRCQEEFWLFATGIGIQSWRSKDLRAWQRGPRVFPSIPAWVKEIVPAQRGHFWAPDIHFHHGRYLLYYSVSSFGRNTSAIALASNPTLNPAAPDYHWTDHGVVIQSGAGDNFNAIDPAVIRTAAGELWLTFGSYWSGIQLVQLDPNSGRRLSPDSPPYPLASHDTIEAPHIHFHAGFYYLFVNWGTCCRSVHSTYNIRVGRSRQITGPYLDKNGSNLLQGGGSLLLESDGPFIGPGHASLFEHQGTSWFSCHFYDATDHGRSRLALCPLTWDKAHWPVLTPANLTKPLESAASQTDVAQPDSPP